VRKGGRRECMRTLLFWSVPGHCGIGGDAAARRAALGGGDAGRAVRRSLVCVRSDGVGALVDGVLAERRQAAHRRGVGEFGGDGAGALAGGRYRGPACDMGALSEPPSLSSRSSSSSFGPALLGATGRDGRSRPGARGDGHDISDLHCD